MARKGPTLLALTQACFTLTPFTRAPLAGAAVLGLVVAASCLMLTKATGNAAYDAVGCAAARTVLSSLRSQSR